MSEERAACPECRGKGSVKAFGCPGFKPLVLPCQMCNGLKTVEAKILLWVKLGEELRQDRRSRQKTLRAEAQERGMKASDLSDMERGLREPIVRKR